MRRLWPGLLALTLFAGGLGRDAFDDWVGRTVLPPLAPALSVEVTARDGTLLRAFPVDDGRWRMDPGPVDPLFRRMLIAYEDGRFDRHSGVDLLALVRAAGQTVLKGRVVSGGSTLTMQVARLLEDSGTGRIQGKVRQIRLALALERHLTKDEILSLYLRIAPYGGNLEGVRAASLAYFGKEPRRLTAAEAALLVALPQSPEARRPDRSPVAAEAARARVLARMEAAGVLPHDRANAALREAVPRLRRDFPALAPHLAEALRADNPGEGRIRTTLDARLQAALERLAATAVRQGAETLSAAIVVADHRTGEILASVGGADWTDERRKGFVDLTRAIRSPGSTLKPFVYALAFDEGLAHPETLIADRPVTFGTYAPQNFDGVFRGVLPVREALQLSLNIPVVRLTDALGPGRLLSLLRRTGAKPLLPGGQPGLAVALGGVGLSLQDLVQSYAALARMGAPIRLTVRPGRAEALPGRLFRADAAWHVADILKGAPVPPNAPPGRLAFKTGTSYGHRDAWAVGFDGAHVAGVWMGRADGSPVPGAFGGELAAPILFEVFGRIAPDFTPLPPPPPATLMMSNAELPAPLQRFRGLDGKPDGLVVQSAPELSFPPDGAEVEAAGAGLTVRVRSGTPPFTWLANGRPVVVADREREARLEDLGPGFYRLSVLDAAGRSASVSVTLR